MYYHPYPYIYSYLYPLHISTYNYDANCDWNNQYSDQYRSLQYRHSVPLKDYGREPFVININKAAKQNRTFRTALWTGEHLQVTLMSIKVGEDIGLEVHPHVDQFLRIEEGYGVVKMGDEKDKLYFQRHISDDDAIMVPAGTWHNVINTGDKPLKLYSIYAPPNHPFGTVHRTKADAIREEGQ